MACTGAYPEEANKHKSIILFPKVVKKYHAMATKEAARHEHIHMATYFSKQRYWRPIVRRAMELVKLFCGCEG